MDTLTPDNKPGPKKKPITLFFEKTFPELSHGSRARLKRAMTISAAIGRPDVLPTFIRPNGTLNITAYADRMEDLLVLYVAEMED